MNENDLRKALRDVRPVDIDDVMITAAIRQAKARRMRLITGIVSIIAMVALVSTLVVWRYGQQTVAVPDPRTSTTATATATSTLTPTTSPTATPTSTPPTSTQPTASLTPSPATTSATATASTTNAGATYAGPTTVLPASFGTVKVKVTADGPIGRSNQYERADATILVCTITPTSLPTLRKVNAAATVVKSAGEFYNAQSVLEFTDTASATAFVAELRRVQATCPSNPTFVPATRPIPQPVPAMADEGVVVGHYVPGSQDGSAIFVGRKGRVVVVTMALVCGDLAKTANGDTDHEMTGPIMDVLSQV